MKRGEKGDGGKKNGRIETARGTDAARRHCAPRVIHNTCARVILVRRMRRLF